MEQIAQRSTYSRPQPLTPPLKLPPYMRLALIILISLAVVIVLIWAASYHPVRASSPFAVFSDVFPGQARSAVESRGFICRTNTYPGSEGETCVINFTTGTFMGIGVLVSQDTIRHTTFTMRENALRLGDLVLLLGSPDIHRYGRSAIFMWLKSGVIASTMSYTEQFPLFRQIWSVSFSGSDLAA